MNRQVFIMRGIPGSGKTSWIRALLQSLVNTIPDPGFDYHYCSADEWHIQDGIYKFDPRNIKRAHDNCFKDFLEGIQVKKQMVVVDNTNLHQWEFSPYYRYAEIQGYEVKIVQVHCPFGVAMKRQTHNVPLDRLWGMYQTLLREQVPAHYKLEVVNGGGL